MSNYKAEILGELLIVQFKGRPTRYEVILSTQEALVTLSQHRFSRAIVDTRELEILFPMSMNWFRNTWYPKAVESGLKTLAIVVPREFLGDIKVAPKELGQYQPGKEIDMKFFVDMNKARDWVYDNGCHTLSASA